ncbi:hypothetical protein H4219_004714 [Mycoemilia scoparia]|uniref:Chitin-binding type-2 domain-containing protein n=1 Tax=Mycoemilia scoparia TaxID=417184 RepID=A0A9W7ZQP6_9FUNG|nr:hypothetical protein H4219_004714 [Mycoemilia scoparia]
MFNFSVLGLINVSLYALSILGTANATSTIDSFKKGECCKDQGQDFKACAEPSVQGCPRFLVCQNEVFSETSCPANTMCVDKGHGKISCEPLPETVNDNKNKGGSNDDCHECDKPNGVTTKKPNKPAKAKKPCKDNSKCDSDTDSDSDSDTGSDSDSDSGSDGDSTNSDSDDSDCDD